MESITVEVLEGVATITLNRPDRLNALGAPAMTLLRSEVERVAEDESIRAVILTGAGRGFCAGGDLADLSGSDAQSSADSQHVRSLMDISTLLQRMPKATIAAVNGACAGAALGFVASCDLRFAATSAIFVTAFLRVGVPGDHGAIWSMTQAVGPARARALFLLGDRFNAEEAENWGLIHAVLSDEELIPHARAVAKRLSQASPVALAAMKANLNDALTLPFDRYVDRETERFTQVLGGGGVREAVLTYLEKE